MADDSWADVDPSVPVLLLPVRLECRSSTVPGGGTVLRVRIYPDDVAIDDLEATLGDLERDAGDAYWRARWTSPPDPDGADPWAVLVAAVGAMRAAWVATARTPSNLVDRGAGVDPVPPAEPEDGARPPGAWARCLPDVFRVVVAQGDAVSTATGEGVDRDGVLVGAAGRDLPAVVAAARALGAGPGPDPDAPAGPGWLADYAEAERIGMAVTVPLAAGDVHVDRLLVLGARTGVEPDAAAADFATLLAAHAVGDGLALLAPGTPTNTTPASRAAWSRSGSAPGAPPTEMPTARPGTVGAALAQALGLDPALAAAIDGADDLAPTWTEAFATALWPVTWGPFLDRSFSSVLSPQARSALRAHAETYVRGGGPLPTLRVGRQPYGVLPTTSWSEYRTTSSLDGGVNEVLDRLRPFWAQAVAAVPTVMGADLDVALPAVLGQGPVSRAVRVRRVLSMTGVTRTAAYALGEHDQTSAQRVLLRAVEHVLGLAGGSVAEDAVGSTTATIGLPLAHDSDAGYLTSLLEGRAAGDQQSVLQVLLTLAVATLRAEVAALGGEQRWSSIRALLSEAVAVVGDEAVRRGVEALDALDAGRFEDTQQLSVAADLLDREGAPWSAGAFARRYPVEALRPNPLDAARDQVEGVQAAAVLVRAGARLAQLLDAVRTIASVPSTARRAWMLGETLDCTSHRLDAWVTSLATARLASLRQGRPTGIVLGAYGWLEDLDIVTPSPVTDPPPEVEGELLQAAGHLGVVHAPSPAHAATAAVLLGARLAHQPDDGSAAPLDIDLSGARVRAALEVLDGIRGGQSLGALLGYRLERWLHEWVAGDGGVRRLDRFVYVLRAAAPLVAGKVTERVTGAAAAPTTLEHVAASQVVDGIRLLEQVKDGLDLAARLGQPPPGFTAYAEGAWAPPTNEESSAVAAAVDRMDRLHDAIADVLLSEGVHQLVAGNPTRASAAMDALAGDGLPPDPEVVSTPRSGVPLTHQLAVVLADPHPRAAHGWINGARSAADPALERWLRTALGPATRIALAADADGIPTHTLADAGISALELVAATGGVSTAADTAPGAAEAVLFGLTGRLRIAVPGLAELALFARVPGLPATVLTVGEAWALASSLRSLIAGARALSPADLVRPGEVGALDPVTGATMTTRPVDVIDLRARASAAVAALEALDLDVPADRDGRLALVLALARFGVVSPADATAFDDDALGLAASQLAARAQTRRTIARAALDAAPPAPPAGDLASETAAVRALTEVLGTVFDDGLPSLPVLMAAADPFAAAWSGGAPVTADGAAVRPWLSRLARVRPGVARHTEVLLLRAALGRGRRLRVVQQPPGAAPTWIGLPFDESAPPPTQAVFATVIEAARGLDPTGRICGLVVDTWTETVPRRRTTTDPQSGQSRTTDVRTTGLAVHANGPDSRAPQALLLAVSPDGEPWTWQRAAAVLDDTRMLARMRLVTLDHAPLAGRVLPAAYEQDWALQGEPVIDPRLLREFADVNVAMRHVREEV